MTDVNISASDLNALMKFDGKNWHSWNQQTTDLAFSMRALRILNGTDAAPILPAEPVDPIIPAVAHA